MLFFLKQILNILDPLDKKRLFILFFLSLIASFFDVITIGVFFPYLKMIQDTEKFYALIEEYTGILITMDKFIFIISVSVSIVLIYLCRIGYLLFFEWIQTKLSYSISKKNAIRLMKSYMYSSYISYVEKNVATLIHNIQIAINITVLTIYPIITILSSFIILFFISILLIYIDITTFLLILCSIIVVIYFFLSFSKKRLKKISILNIKYSRILNLSVLEGLHSFKELIVINKQTFFLERFQKSINMIQDLVVKQRVLSASTKYVIEFTMITIMLCVFIYKIYSNEDSMDIIIDISVFGIASFRLLPILYTMLLSLTNIQYGKEQLNAIYQDIKKTKHIIPDTSLSSTIKFEQCIELRNVTFSYEDGKNILNDVSLKIEKNTCIAFCGQSGVGKTTIADIILGILPIEKGNIYIDGKKLNPNAIDWKKKLGYISQHIFIRDASIMENVAFGIEEKYIDKKKVELALKNANLYSFIEEQKDKLNTRIGANGIKLSGGQRQRIGIARALYLNPEILVMDEATSSLDNQSEQHIIDSIEKIQGTRTVIIIAHRLDTIKNCDTIFFMKAGKIHKIGTYEELLQDEEFLKFSNKV